MKTIKQLEREVASLQKDVLLLRARLDQLGPLPVRSTLRDELKAVVAQGGNISDHMRAKQALIPRRKRNAKRNQEVS